LDINQWLGFAALVIGSWLGSRIVKPRDSERASLLAEIAKAAAALAVSMNPNASWKLLLVNVVNQIATAAGVPTKNQAAIQRAAALALTDLGVKPAP
jgi:predicted MFS family arabinose efflux permease